MPKLLIERAWHDAYSNVNADELPLSDSFVSAQKDGDNIKLTKISGAQTTVGPFSGGGTAASSTTNYPTSAMTSNGGFSGTPPAVISLSGSGSWAATREYVKEDESNQQKKIFRNHRA